MFHLGLAGGFTPGLQRVVNSGFPSAFQQADRHRPPSQGPLSAASDSGLAGGPACRGDTDGGPGRTGLWVFGPSQEHRTSPLRLQSGFLGTDEEILLC